MAERNNKGQFTEGNRLWRLNENVGVDLKYTPDTFLKVINDYFEWSIENPIIKYVNVNTKDGVVKADEEYARPFTKHALCIYMGISRKNFDEYKKRVDNIPKNLLEKGQESKLKKYKEDADRFSNVSTRAEEIIYSQKFEGASVGLFNAAIMVRELSLINKEHQTVQTEQPFFPNRFNKN
jgi:hypothetical protein